MGFQVGQNSLNAPADGEFLINMMQMRLHCIDRDAQLIGNFFVAPTGGCARQDFSFSIGQLGEQGGMFLRVLSQCAGNGLNEMARYDRRQDMFSSSRRADDAHEIRLIGVLQDIAEGAALHGGDNPDVFVVPGQQQHSGIGYVLMDERGERFDLKVRVIDVQEIDIGLVFNRQLIGLVSICRFQNGGDILLSFQQQPQALSKQSLRFDKKQSDGPDLGSAISSMRRARHTADLASARLRASCFSRAPVSPFMLFSGCHAKRPAVGILPQPSERLRISALHRHGKTA
jgi:hypothetical protein